VILETEHWWDVLTPVWKNARALDSIVLSILLVGDVIGCGEEALNLVAALRCGGIVFKGETGRSADLDADLEMFRWRCFAGDVSLEM